MRFLTKTLVATAAAAAFAGPAAAVDIDVTGFAYGSSNVTYVLGSNAAQTVAAGAFSGLLGGQSFAFYCIDLLQTVNFADGAYSYNPSGPLSYAAPLGQLMSLFGTVDTALESAAFQVAVWELAYETSGTYNVTSSAGSIEFTGDAAVLAQAQTYLNQLGGLTLAPFAAYQSQTYQDVITAPIPEPETYALMAAGLGALGWVARRRKAKDAAKA